MSTVLAEGILQGRRIAVVPGVGAAGATTGADAVADGCTALGAVVHRLDVPDGERPLDGLDALVCDGGALFSAAPAGVEALRACADGCFAAVSALARSLIAQERAGRLIAIAPPPGAGLHADAARAALENLARTLSIEWSGRGITIVAVAPGDATPTRELAQVVAFLLSHAGDYCTGTLLDLRG